MTTTSKATHTPGPWGVIGEVHGGTDCTIVGPLRPHPQGRELGVSIQTRTRIAHIFCPNYTEQEANARLIAAAPELLEALEHAHIYFLQNDNLSPDDREMLDEMWAPIRKVRCAR